MADTIGAVFALFESLGGIELVVVGIGALLLFGKDLPRVAADAGAQFTKLKRSLDSTWRETGLEKEVRQIRDALPRDLSLGDVARTAHEKLTIRLEAEELARKTAAGAPGAVARGSAVEPLLHEPVEHPAVPTEADPAATDAAPAAAVPPASPAPPPDANR